MSEQVGPLARIPAVLTGRLDYVTGDTNRRTSLQLNLGQETADQRIQQMHLAAIARRGHRVRVTIEDIEE